jgi:hypothetical protein
MASRRWKNRLRPILEFLEGRLALSSVTPANVIGTSSGLVSHPHQISRTSAAVQQNNLTPHKHVTLFGLFVQPTQGSNLRPRIVDVTGTQGRALPVKHGRHFKAGVHTQTVAFTRVSQPTQVTTAVTGATATTGAFQTQTTLVGDVNGDGAVNILDVQAFAKTYMSTQGSENYNPAADFNRNGVINLYDAKALMKNVQPLTPKVPLQTQLTLPPSESIHTSGPADSGGRTWKQNVTILGRTVPGSIVMTDTPTSRLPGGTQIYRFSGPAYATDSNGNFSIPTKNAEGLNNNDLLVLDPFGRTMIIDFPIFWIPYAKGGPVDANGVPIAHHRRG